ncbi:hypothetical protein C8Q73DRAFT_219752 [Cubamyces lactineus]|nr:hypothetical protein C8Q73DRAFT_219752 [Cubamyces lactineus]
MANSLEAAVLATPAAVQAELPGPDSNDASSASSWHLRDQLPRTLYAWRIPPLVREVHIASLAEGIWKLLGPFFKQRGYTFWKINMGCLLCPDIEEDLTMQNSIGYGYVSPVRGIEPTLGSLDYLFSFENLNPLCRAARTDSGLDVVVRVLKISDQGQEHVDILKTIATGPLAFFSNNHTIPVLEFLGYEDIVFGVFPKVGFRVWEAYDGWPENSVGDVVDMIVQCFEALSFIHQWNIAHRDAFKENFLVQWHPESLKIDEVPPSRPRVFLIDFEVAVMFPHSMEAAECLVSGYPIGGSFPDDIKEYAHPVPPEVISGKPYDPFKLDVWQLGTSLKDFKSAFTEIDEILDATRRDDAAERLTSIEAMACLSRAVAKLTPQELMIKPQSERYSGEEVLESSA